MKPALGIPIIIATILLFMTGYVHFVVSNSGQPEAADTPPQSPAVLGTRSPAPVDPGQEPASNGSPGLSQNAMPAGRDVKSWTGRIAGYVDNELIVIYVGDEAKTFLVPQELAGADLVKGDNVSFDFFLNQNGQPVLSSIKKLVPPE